MITSLILGPEYDHELQRRVLSVLRDMGADFREEEWGMAGSQELASRIAIVGGHRLRIEAETYIGLSLTGDENIVSQVAAEVNRRAAS